MMAGKNSGEPTNNDHVTPQGHAAVTRSWLSSLLAAPVIAVGSVVNLLGSAALAFPAALSPHIDVVIGTMLAASIVAGSLGAVTAAVRGTLMETQEAPAMLLGLMGVSLFAALPEGLDEEARVGTVIVAFALTTVACGLFFLVLGWLRLGELIRYIPFPVIGGVLAGLGLLMMEGGLSVVTGLDMRARNVPLLFELDILLRWGPALVFAVVIGLVSSRFQHFSVIPILLVAATIIFYTAALSVGAGLERLATDGWLLGPFSQGTLFQTIDYGALARIDGGTLLSLVPEMAAVVLVATISILLHGSALELATREEVELNSELRSCGLGNIGAGLAGGAPIFHSVASTLLTRKIGAGNRATPLLVVAFWVLVLCYGGSLLGYFPRPVLAGLLLFLGGGLLWEWLVRGFHKLPKGDWVVVVLIVLTVAFVGYIEGIGVGMLAGMVLFQIGYTKMDVVKHALAATSFHSNVERSASDMASLEAHGERILVLQLQGYIFFGTANNIVLKAREYPGASGRESLDWLLLDFRHVRGLDWAAVMSFRKLEQMADESGFSIIYSIPDEEVLATLKKGDIIKNEHERVFDNLDHAMEWCEDQLLAGLGVSSEAECSPDALPDLITRSAPDPGQQTRLREYLIRKQYEPGDVLMEQGEETSFLMLIQGGRASIYIEDDWGNRTRVKSFEAGSIIGELGLYSGAPRAATVTADSEIIAFILKREDFEAMRAVEADLARRLDGVIIDLLARRLVDTNRLVASLME